MPDISFKSGRIDCEDSPYTDEIFDFPGATMGREEMFEYFEDHFGFNATWVRKK